MFTLSLFLALKLSPRGAPLSVASLAGRGPAGTKHAVVAVGTSGCNHRHIDCHYKFTRFYSPVKELKEILRIGNLTDETLAKSLDVYGLKAARIINL